LLLHGKTASKQDFVRIEKQCTAGQDIRPIGSDVAVGQLVLEKGTLLRAAEIGILATVGAFQVEVFRTPAVAVFSTGDELSEPDVSKLPLGHIRDSNRYMLLSALHGLGCEVVDLGIASDATADLESKLAEGLNRADVILTSGGVSMGELDLMKPLLEKFGTVHFGRVLMKPGKPLTFATVNHVPNNDSSSGSSTSSQPHQRSKLIFGLPGNPVSSLVTFTLFVVPSLKKVSGWANPHHRTIKARTTSDIRLDPLRPEYHRATISWDHQHGCYSATSTGRQISSRLLSMVSANAFLIIPQGDGKLPTGSMVDALHIDLY